MTIEKTARLAVRLLERTRSGELEWVPTKRDDAFEAAFPGASVLVAREEGHTLASGPDYTLSVLDADGRLIHAATDLDLQAHLGEEAFPVMRDLHESARGSAMGVEKTLDRILQVLESAG